MTEGKNGETDDRKREGRIQTDPRVIEGKNGETDNRKRGGRIRNNPWVTEEYIS